VTGLSQWARHSSLDPAALSPPELSMLKLTACLLASLMCVAAVCAADAPKGALPLGKDGKALNTDFESGELRDWTATGGAWKGQPVKGPINPKRKLNRAASRKQFPISPPRWFFSPMVAASGFNSES